jgi:hypothetical protein
MTILNKSIKIPRLRGNDSNCVLSWFDGNDPTTGSTTGNFVNNGSLGDLTDLKLNSTVSSVRDYRPGFSRGEVVIINPTLSSHGYSTVDTSLGESTSITFDCWLFLDSSNSCIIMVKNYNSGFVWSSPYGSVILGMDNSYKLQAFTAVNGSSYDSHLPTGNNAYLPTKQWVHVGLSIGAGSYLKMYINGALIYTSASTYNILWGNHGCWGIGGRGGRGTITALQAEGVYGSVQGARVHNIERSSSWFSDTYYIGVGKL